MVHGMNREWFVGSNNGTEDKPNYQYNGYGWPFFIGVNETEPAEADYHIATGIQNFALAVEIAIRHNETLLKEEGLDEVVQVTKPKPHTAFVNLYERSCAAGSVGLAYKSKKIADKKASCTRVACVRVDYHIGQVDEVLD